MGKKIWRTKVGKVEVKSIRLPNGNLLIPSRDEIDRDLIGWKEVRPGTSDYKRWASVAVDEHDPRRA